MGATRAKLTAKQRNFARAVVAEGNQSEAYRQTYDASGSNVRTMRIKSIVAATAITLATGIGFASANELSVADTAVNTGTPFAMLDGIATEQLSVQELGATRGAVVAPSMYPSYFMRLVGSRLDAIAPNSLTVKDGHDRH